MSISAETAIQLTYLGSVLDIAQHLCINILWDVEKYTLNASCRVAARQLPKSRCCLLKASVMSSTEEASSSPLSGCDLLTAKSLNIGAGFLEPRMCTGCEVYAEAAPPLQLAHHRSVIQCIC